MKKFISMLLLFIYVLTVSSCTVDRPNNNDKNVSYVGDSNDDENSTKDEDGNNDRDDKKEKIFGTITAASTFSEGKAFVCVEEKPKKTYCINEKGEILFELDKKVDVAGDIYVTFVNGYAFLDGAVCDINGQLTYPQDVGVTKFYGVALEGGYIVAEKTTSDFTSSKKELGILNTRFEWILQPSETIYQKVGENLWLTETINTKSYFCDKFIYFVGADRYLNVQTGDILETMPCEILSEKLKFDTNVYKNGREEVVIDLSRYSTILSGTEFKNGNAVIRFYNPDISKEFFTVIDREGNFAFDPIEIKLNTVSQLQFDGDCILVQDQPWGSDINLVCYNLNGQIMGEFNVSTLGTNRNYSFNINQGIIVVYSGYDFSYKIHYFTPAFLPLF